MRKRTTFTDLSQPRHVPYEYRPLPAVLYMDDGTSITVRTKKAYDKKFREGWATADEYRKIVLARNQMLELRKQNAERACQSTSAAV